MKFRAKVDVPEVEISGLQNFAVRTAAELDSAQMVRDLGRKATWELGKWRAFANSQVQCKCFSPRLNFSQRKVRVAKVEISGLQNFGISRCRDFDMSRFRDLGISSTVLW